MYEKFIVFFFSVIEKREVLMSKTESALKEKKKVSCGTLRELKRLESSISYDGKKKESKAASGIRMLCE